MEREREVGWVQVAVLWNVKKEQIVLRLFCFWDGSSLWMYNLLYESLFITEFFYTLVTYKILLSLLMNNTILIFKTFALMLGLHPEKK